MLSLFELNYGSDIKSFYLDKSTNG